MAIISLKGVTFSYDQNASALNDINLEIEKGQYLAIVGHNGSGKSTLARIFNGLLIPEQGDVFVDGISLNDKTKLFEARSKVGVVFQNPDNQLVASIVEDDIAFGPENLGICREEIGKRIEYALKSVGMEEFRRSSPERLSGGQKQRIAIAGVLALKPDVIVLDESTSMLDPEGRQDVLRAVKKLNEEGVTVVTITHYMEEVVDADRVIVLNGGRIVLDGTPEEVFRNKEIIKNSGLELPYVSYIAEKLKQKGVDIQGEILTEKGLVEELCRLKRKI